MRNLLICFLLFPAMLSAQQSTNNLDFEGQNRTYIQYIPNSYDGSEPVAVIISLHGLGDNMNNFSQVGFHDVADTENIIVVTPQALVDPFLSATAWNSGAGLGTFVLNANVNDVGFLSAIIDTLSNNYNIDLTRIYATGFSMGGFMSNRLACELGDRIAAIASVAGTIGVGITCEPSRAIPTCHFHGTADQTVPYEGNQYGNDAEPLFEFWSSNNNCAVRLDSTSSADIVADGITITKFTRYQNCDDNAITVFYRADGAAHNWLYTPANDIDYTTEIWNFFSDKTHPNPKSGLNELNTITFEMFPNPAQNTLNIQLAQQQSPVQIAIYNVLGEKMMFKQGVSAQQITLDISMLNPGSYVVQVGTVEQVTSRAFTKM